MASKLSLSLPLRRAHSMDTVPAEDACATEAAEPLSPVTPMLPRRSSLDASLGMLRRISAPALMLAGAPPADATSLLPPQLLDSDKLAYNGLWKKDWAASEDMVRPDWWGLRRGRRHLSAPRFPCKPGLTLPLARRSRLRQPWLCLG